MDKILAQAQATFATVSKDLAKQISQVDLKSLQNLVHNISVKEIYAGITHPLFVQYVVLLIFLNAATGIVFNQRARGSFSPFYVVFATIFAAALAPTTMAVLSGQKIPFLTTEEPILFAAAIALAAQFGLAYIYYPFSFIGRLLIAAATTNVIAASYKLGMTNYQTFTAAFVFSAIDVSLRVLPVAFEAYLVDGTSVNFNSLRVPVSAVGLYTYIMATTGQQELAQVAAFALLALSVLLGLVGITLNPFLPIDLVFRLFGSPSPKTKSAPVKAEVKTEAAKAQQKVVSPNKK